MNPSRIFSTPTSCFSLEHLLTIFLKLTTLPSTMWYYMVLILINLKCSFDVLFLYYHYSLLVPLLYDVLETPQVPEQALQITRYGRNERGGSEQCCAVCLDEVKEGEEIGELRCFHVFHKLCLERWVRLEHVTCPLCRGSLAPPMRNSTEEEIEREVLLFKFCFFHSEDDDRDSWRLQ